MTPVASGVIGIAAPTLFDGIAVACAVMFTLLAFAFYSIRSRTEGKGSVFFGWGMGLAAFAWGSSATFGSFVRYGSYLQTLPVQFAALVSVCLLLLGCKSDALAGHLPHRLLGGVCFCAAFVGQVGAKFGLLPAAAADISVASIFGVACLYSLVAAPNGGWFKKFPLTVGLGSYPILLCGALYSGLALEEIRQLAGLALVLLAMLIFLNQFFGAHERMMWQYLKTVQSDARLRELVYTDSSTGLDSAHCQREMVTELLASGTPFAILAISLDDLLVIKENLGLTASNALVAAGGVAIRDALGNEGSLARAIDYEYAILVRGEIGLEALERLSARIGYAVGALRTRGAFGAPLHVSIGIVRSPVDGTEVDEVYRLAMLALNYARARGRNGVSIFAASMDQAAKAQLWLDTNLDAALAAGEFSLEYQPKLDLETRCAVGVEALLRWNHPERGAISPSDFIPRAEATGLIKPIGRWVLRAVAEQAALWKAMGLDVRVAINISVKQIDDPALLGALEAAQLVAHGLLDVELTESCISGFDSGIAQFITRCREFGYGVHLDDFGTGYSSLSRLVDLPLTMIKLDRSFVGAIGLSTKADAVIRAMVKFGNELELAVVAEGIETTAQAHYVSSLGIRYGQGWLYAKSLPPGQCGAWLLANRPVAAQDVPRPLRPFRVVSAIR